MNSLSNNNINNTNPQTASVQSSQYITLPKRASVQSSQYITLPNILRQPQVTTQKTADKAEIHTSNEGQMFHNVSNGQYVELPKFLPKAGMPQFSPKEGFTPRQLEPGEGKVNYTKQSQDFYSTVTGSTYDSGYDAFGEAKVPTENPSPTISSEPQNMNNVSDGHYVELPKFLHEDGSSATPRELQSGEGETKVSNENTPSPVANASNAQPTRRKRSRSITDRLSGLFNREIKGEKPSKVSKAGEAQKPETTVVQDESKKNLDKIKKEAAQIGEIVQNALISKKDELKKTGSVELDIEGMGKVTVLKSNRRSLFQSGFLYVRFSEGAHLGSGAFKDVELGIKLKSLNRSIPVAIARAKVQSDSNVLRSEHETSQKMKSLFGDSIFASKRMINLGNDQEGFIMPLAHGDYRSPKVKGPNGKPDIQNRTGLEKLSKEKKVANAKVILETLRKMESAGFVHGDFKEDNVFLDANGDPQIADWGAAYSREDFEDKTKLRSRKTQIESDIVEATSKNETEKLKGLQTELSNLSSDFDSLTRTAKYSWACIVFESFSAAEWAEVKYQIISAFGDDPKLNWTDEGPFKVPIKRNRPV